jgi:ABC-type phosphate transport system auxiliary subunit
MSPINPHEQGESLEYRELDASKEACPDLTERGEAECLPRLNQAREPDDIDRVNRELRGVNRRLDRLEYTQISPQEFSSVLDRIYEEIAASRSEMRAEFVAVNARLDSLDTKIDIIIRRLSGEGNLGA